MTDGGFDNGPRLVSEVWKWIAIVSVGIILGGAPGYAVLAFDNRNAVTMPQVDHEIQVSNGAIVQKLSDLDQTVQNMSGKVDSLVDSPDEPRRSRR